MEGHEPPRGSRCVVIALHQYPLPDWLLSGSVVTVMDARIGQTIVTVKDAHGRIAELLRVSIKALPPERMRS